MMKAADRWDRYDAAIGRDGDRARDRRVLVERQMRFLRARCTREGGRPTLGADNEGAAYPKLSQLLKRNRASGLLDQERGSR
jgi:hypothetical protein